MYCATKVNVATYDASPEPIIMPICCIYWY